VHTVSPVPVFCCLSVPSMLMEQVSGRPTLTMLTLAERLSAAVG
jgi:hypothetical protein